jgi:FeS assembly SUF system regulator
MIKLGKMTDYAVALLVQLAREGAGAAKSAHYLAAQTGLPEPTAAKILKQLARGRVVDSVRGAAGGYRLSALPSDISVCQVVEVMDGPIAIASCVDNTCDTSAQCPTRGKWNPVNAAIKSALQAVTLADMDVNARPAQQQTFIQITGGTHAHIK